MLTNSVNLNTILNHNKPLKVFSDAELSKFSLSEWKEVLPCSQVGHKIHIKEFLTNPWQLAPKHSELKVNLQHEIHGKAQTVHPFYLFLQYSPLPVTVFSEEELTKYSPVHLKNLKKDSSYLFEYLYSYFKAILDNNKITTILQNLAHFESLAPDIFKEDLFFNKTNGFSLLLNINLILIHEPVWTTILVGSDLNLLLFLKKSCQYFLNVHKSADPATYTILEFIDALLEKQKLGESIFFENLTSKKTHLL